MANNLALTALLLTSLLALQATATTITVEDETNPGQAQQCQQHLQGRRFQSCQRYLSSQRSKEQETTDELIEMSIENPREQEEEKQYLNQCCQQLRNVDRQCRCEAIKHAVRQVQQGQEGYQGEQMQQVYQKARSLPQRCQMKSPQQCDIRAVFL